MALKGAAQQPAQRWLIGQLCQAPCRAAVLGSRGAAIGRHPLVWAVPDARFPSQRPAKSRSKGGACCCASGNAVETRTDDDPPNLSEESAQLDPLGTEHLSAEDIVQLMRKQTMLDIPEGTEVPL